jgi:hypothetical protein
MANSDQDLIFKLQIQALVVAATIAIQTQDAGSFTGAVRQLLSLTENIEVSPELQDDAKQLHDTLAIEMEDTALQAMSDKVANLTVTAAGLNAAIAVAKGTKLSVPAVATAAKQALKSLTDVQQAVAQVRKDLLVSSLRTVTPAQLKGIPDQVKGLLTDLQTLKDAVGSV